MLLFHSAPLRVRPFADRIRQAGKHNCSERQVIPDRKRHDYLMSATWAVNTFTGDHSAIRRQPLHFRLERVSGTEANKA